MQEFTGILQKATKAIKPEYFLLPVYGDHEPIFRERVYCYELYHQLRKRWRNADYCLNGEIDKRGHPDPAVIALGHVVPDFLIHKAGQWLNYAVMEVKPRKADSSDEQIDIDKLIKFRELDYKRLIYLIYGEMTPSQLCRVKDKIGDSPIELWWHDSPGRAAKQI